MEPGESDEECDTLGIFAEPEGFYEPEKQPTTVSHQLLNGKELSLRLVGHSPLWGHHLWQAAQVISTYLQTHAQSLITNKTILELGAAAGLPSIISSLYGAKYVLATDYPDADLVENLQLNIRTNCQENNISAAGYLWGADPAPLLAHIPHTGTDGFDLLILADLLFNHSEHHALLRTVKATLSHSPGAQALVFFTPYRPWLFEKDMAFFTLAQDRSQGFDFRVEKILEERMEKVMFEEDPGDETLRRTVFGYRITWADGNE